MQAKWLLTTSDPSFLSTLQLQQSCLKVTMRGAHLFSVTLNPAGVDDPSVYDTVHCKPFFQIMSYLQDTNYGLIQKIMTGGCHSVEGKFCFVKVLTLRKN